MGGKSAPAPPPSIDKMTNSMHDIGDSTWASNKSAMSGQAGMLATGLQRADSGFGMADRAAQQSHDMYGSLTQEHQKFAGLAGKMADDARNYNSAAEQERMAQTAGEDVAGAVARGQEQMGRGLAARGVNPNSGAAIAAMNDNSMNGAMAQAQATNQARQAAKEIGWNKLVQANQASAGLGALASSYGQTAQQFGAQRMGAAGAGLGMVGQALGNYNQAASGASGVYGSAINGANNAYANNLQAWNMTQQNDPTRLVAGAVIGGASSYFTGGLMGRAGSTKNDN